VRDKNFVGTKTVSRGKVFHSCFALRFEKSKKEF